MGKNLDLHIESLPIHEGEVIDKNNPLNVKFLDYIHSRSNVVIFSPHLDDAVLSMGSLLTYIARKGMPVEVVSVFTEGSNATSPSIQKLVENGNCKDSKSYFNARRDEDIVALKELGNISARHLNFADSAWRTDSNGNPLYQDSIMATIKREDAELQEKLIDAFKTVIKVTDSTAVFAPLARGRHIDHQHTRNTAKQVFPNALFYEDFPYSGYLENEVDFIQKNNLEPVVWKGSYEAKKRSILQYKTQLVSLFKKGSMHLPYERYFTNSLQI